MINPITPQYKPLTRQNAVDIDWEVFDDESQEAISAMIDRWAAMGYDPNEVRECTERALKTCQGVKP